MVTPYSGLKSKPSKKPASSSQQAGLCCLSFEGSRVRQARNQHDIALLASCFMLISCFLFLLFSPED
jgi:hypothetical protein